MTKRYKRDKQSQDFFCLVDKCQVRKVKCFQEERKFDNIHNVAILKYWLGSLGMKFIENNQNKKLISK